MEDQFAQLLTKHGIEQCHILAINSDNQQPEIDYCHKDTTQDSIFHLYSGTKLYTALAVLLLIQREKIPSLDSLVTDVVLDKDSNDDEGYTTFFQSEALQGVTIRHLLAHTSGLKDTPMAAFLAVHFEGEDLPSTWDTLRQFRLVRKSPPPAKPEYANVNFCILGELITKASGKPFADFVQAEILPPLQSGAKFHIDSNSDEVLVKGTMGYWTSILLKLINDPADYKKIFEGSEWLRDARAYKLRRNFYMNCSAAGGLCGTAQDFVPYLQLVLQYFQDNKQTPDWIEEHLWKELFTLQAQGPGCSLISGVGMGLGWKKAGAADVQYWHHEGGGGGFTSETRIYPDDNLGIVILMNSWSANYAESTLCHQLCGLIREHVAKKRADRGGAEENN
ncbi:Beta-lactamase [Seminavis robusta]|uniref:Beta-lactamase n=1 Tax=Seminavis robusta TaxID=568900 RepID=A0A9N8H965_9STRA|nr:Beta-lactamase [Seminavis robusta]|eukprot:Sro265_g102730.1 Beta-lactamase (392) ;mRNA; f:18277-19452